ncbi:AraC-type DNA-binding protein [Lentzea xinjiangensis]|uniref:AraC-type DNA-binding protein n=1 Tax=Lentzea xinjiangensis TaxID=402600 RepID=A0A1H9TJ70_9PSEU|nr:AraC family transcriptional regulator [Lentzea xinjiangensis]SER97211.1 AraC-type DNA-binding protein [Lentzea xinjiangensis]
MSDPLGEALHLLRMSGTFYCRNELTEPWGLTMPDMADCLWFHVLTSGRCDVEVDGEITSLEPGDVLLVPGGQSHRLFHGEAESPLVTTLPHTFETSNYAILRHGAGGAMTHLVCGAVRFDDPAAKHLVDVLPHMLCVRRADDMRATIDLMAAEARTLRPGGEAVITRLADVLVIQTIRSWLATDPAARTGWLGALQDQQIGRALALIHRDPAQPWTVERLAHQTAMSRSAFAARFTGLVGEPAMRYVTRWRMHVAMNRLRDRDSTVSEIARGLGYESEAAFSRAFKRIVGVSPGQARAG